MGDLPTQDPLTAAPLPALNNTTITLSGEIDLLDGSAGTANLPAETTPVSFWATLWDTFKPRPVNCFLCFDRRIIEERTLHACQPCRGHGFVNDLTQLPRKCQECGGSLSSPCQRCRALGPVNSLPRPPRRCQECGGRGKVTIISHHRCFRC